MTYNGNRYKHLLLPAANANNIPMMRNAYDRYSTATDRFLPLRDVPSTGHLVIDSGGFNVLATGNESYPWTVTDYHDWLSYLPVDFEWAAVMDFACETRFDELLSKKARIEKTLENTIAHFEHDPEYELLPVLQGRTLRDYLQFYDRLKDHGIPTDYVGLGTVCRKSNTSEIIEIERGIRANTDIQNIHGFGVKISAFKLGATFDTADSNAWNSEPSNGNVVFDAGTKLRVEESDQPRKRAYRSFLEYYKYASRLQQQAINGQNGSQEALSAFTV
jgi:hypothetical protein